MGASTPQVRQQPGVDPLIARVLIIILVSVAVVLIGTIGYSSSARNYAGQMGVLAQNGRPVHIVASRGQTIELGIEVQEDNFNGWASDEGLALTFEGMNTPLPVVEPKQRDWGSSLSGSKSSSFIVRGHMTVPSSIGAPEQRSLSGQIRGRVLYATPWFASFTEKTVEINVPLQLQLVPPGSSGGWLLFIAFVAFNVLAYGALALWDLWLLYRPLVLRGFERTTGIIRALPAGIVVAIIGALILWGLFTLGINTGQPTDTPDEISNWNLLIACVAGVCLLLTYVALLAKPGKRSKACALQALLPELRIAL